MLESGDSRAKTGHLSIFREPNQVASSGEWGLTFSLISWGPMWFSVPSGAPLLPQVSSGSRSPLEPSWPKELGSLRWCLVQRTGVCQLDAFTSGLAGGGPSTPQACQTEFGLPNRVQHMRRPAVEALWMMSLQE